VSKQGHNLASVGRKLDSIDSFNSSPCFWPEHLVQVLNLNSWSSFWFLFPNSVIMETCGPFKLVLSIILNTNPVIFLWIFFLMTCLKILFELTKLFLYRERKIPLFGLTKLSRLDIVHIPGEEAVNENVNHEHNINMNHVKVVSSKKWFIQSIEIYSIGRLLLSKYQNNKWDLKNMFSNNL